jgi:hypothetical protein
MRAFIVRPFSVREGIDFDRVQNELIQPALARLRSLGAGKNYLWKRNNLWMIFNALTTGATWKTLIALFNNEREPVGPGDTKHLLSIAREHGPRAVPIDATPLLRSEKQELSSRQRVAQ